MAHNVALRWDGRAAMAHASGTAKPWWDGLDGLHANALPAEAGIEEWITAAGMGFTIESAPVEFWDPNTNMRGTIESKRVLYRDDNQAGLSIVGKRFRPVQPRDIFERFFAPAIEAAGFQLDTAGVLGKGEKYWCLAKTGSGFSLKDGDDFEGYLLLATSCDYSLATHCRFVTLRVVCQNTLDASLMSSGGSAVPAVRVTHRSRFDFDQALRDLSVIDTDASIAAMSQRLRDYQGVRISDAEASSYFNAVLGRDSSGQSRATHQAESFSDLLRGPVAGRVHRAKVEKTPRWVEQVDQSYRYAPGAEPGTLYGALNAVTHFVDHSRGWTRTRSVQAGFGVGQSLKAKAVQVADRLAGLS